MMIPVSNARLLGVLHLVDALIHHKLESFFALSKFINDFVVVIDVYSAFSMVAMLEPSDSPIRKAIPN